MDSSEVLPTESQQGTWQVWHLEAETWLSTLLPPPALYVIWGKIIFLATGGFLTAIKEDDAYG